MNIAHPPQRIGDALAPDGLDHAPLFDAFHALQSLRGVMQAPDTTAPFPRHAGRPHADVRAHGVPVQADDRVGGGGHHPTPQRPPQEGHRGEKPPHEVDPGNVQRVPVQNGVAARESVGEEEVQTRPLRRLHPHGPIAVGLEGFVLVAPRKPNELGRCRSPFGRQPYPARGGAGERPHGGRAPLRQDPRRDQDQRPLQTCGPPPMPSIAPPPVRAVGHGSSDHRGATRTMRSPWVMASITSSPRTIRPKTV